MKQGGMISLGLIFLVIVPGSIILLEKTTEKVIPGK